MGLTVREYEQAMRDMINRVAAMDSIREINTMKLTMDEAEVLSDCIKAGFIRGKTHAFNKATAHFDELRTMDGKAHPSVTNTSIPLKGRMFLHPDRTKFKANLAIGISIASVLIALASVLISLLANADKIIENFHLLFG